MKLYVTILLFVFSLKTFAQIPLFLEKIVENPREIVSATGIKDYYLAGEKVNVVAFVKETDTHKETQLSIPLYVDFIDLANGKLIKHYILKLENGNISLSFSLPSDLATGNYQIRAYTNWMRNFSDDGFFKQNFTVFSQNFKEEMSNVNKQTDIDTLLIHVEGGYLVNGLKSKIAIETKDNFGLKMSVPFLLINNKNDTLVNTKTDTLGLAVFDIVPKFDEKYQVIVKNKTFHLPKTKTEGSVLMVDNFSSKEKIRVFIQNNNAKNDSIGLVLMQNGELIYWKYYPNNKPSLLINIPKNDLEGIIQCYLVDKSGIELGERSIEITSSDASTDILTRDRVLLTKQPSHSLFHSKSLPFAMEKGLSVSGRVNRLNGKEQKKEIQLSMVLTAPKDDTTKQKTTPFFITCKDKFVFENLDFYGKKRITFVAPNNTITLDTALSIPPIYRQKLPINWKLVDKSYELVELEKRKNILILEKIRKERENIMLEEVVVKAKKLDPNAINGISPNIVLDEKRVVNAPSMSSLLFSIIPPRQRRFGPGLKVFIDTQELRQEDIDNIDFDISPASVEKVLVFEEIIPVTYGRATCAVVIVLRRGFNYSLKPNESFIVTGYYKE
ncbi:hypothetical protein [Emticicia sp. SJ17W-69]|uniref:hypothetical protein n=1 Tax=Emticicia sp. SJ17W-69 TaxID=3421657 RepID=UPI003EB8A724